MSEKKPNNRDKLRHALLDAGRAYLRQHGHAGLSIRTLAQEVGVSPGAPYYHFPDRRSLLLALATEGFNEMLAGTEQVLAGKADPADKLRRMGLLFIRFAEDNPHLLDLMYESELTTPTLDPTLLAFQRAGHDALRKQVIGARPGLDEADADVRVVAFWSAIYGFATMRKKGVLRPTHDGVLPTMDIAETIVAITLRAVLAEY
jgi:AcrR family transcriptional regulator